MRFMVLGPLVVEVDGEEVTVSAGRDRTVLAMLLVNAGQIVPVGNLIEAVWDDRPPATAKAQLQSCVFRLRRALPAEAIVSDRAGYGIKVGPEGVDAAVFEELLTVARTSRDPATYRRALDLWRGDALVGVDGHAVRAAAAALDEQRAVATEDWIDAELAAGGARTVLGELTGLVERFPLRERLRGQLMISLYRAGRRGDALAEFRRARDTLRDELGIDPGDELQRVHEEILTASVTAVQSTEAALVRCLPRRVADFSGRGAVAGRLCDAIETRDTDAIDTRGATEPVVVAIDGMAGSGKTTLALHVASLVGDRYGDAHLFVDLHGHSERQPVTPAAALMILLRQLGIAADAIPAELVERVGLWRTELAKRRVLVLFDNAASSAQLVDLLPTSTNSVALITSRRRLTGLDGAWTESLPVLGPDEAVAMLARIGGDRVHQEPEAAAEVARRCGGLPLAIRLAGSRLGHRPTWQVADLARRLGEAALPELAAEDRTVTGAFALSYGQLSAPTQRLLTLLGVYPGGAFDALAVAALTGVALREAETLLGELMDAHLAEEPATGVFRLHDLLREYAETLARDLDPQERGTALLGALDLQLHAALATIEPNARAWAEAELRTPSPARPDLLRELGDPEARLERERPYLLAFVEAAAEHEPGYAWRIPRAAWSYLWRRGYMDDVAVLQERALEVALQLGDLAAEASAANYLASARQARSRFDEAVELVEHSIALRRQLGEPISAGRALNNLAILYYSMGRWSDSIATANAAHDMHRGRAGVVAGHNRLAMLSAASLHLGRYADAMRYQRLRLLSSIDAKDDVWIAACLVKLAAIRHATGTAPLSMIRRYLDAALAVARRTQYVNREAEAHHELAKILSDHGWLDEALTEHRRAIELMLPLNYPMWEAKFRCDAATTLRLAGDVDGARAMAGTALRIARTLRLPYLVARAEAVLADIDGTGEIGSMEESIEDRK